MFTNAELRDMQSFIGKIGQLRYARRTPVTGWTVTKGQYCGPGDTVIEETSCSIEPGTAWWEETLYFRARVTIGPEFDGEEVSLQFQNDGECLLYINGVPAEGLDLNHTLYRLGIGAGQTFDLSVESANRWQNHAHAVQSGIDYPMQVFRRADLLTVCGDVERLYTVLYCLTETADGFAKQWMLKARREINPNAPIDEFLGQAAAYLAAIEPVLAQDKGKSFTVLAAGHSHLDLGYLWPIKETVRKLGRTFANMLYLLDNYPEFRFTQSQAVLFEWARDYYPDLYARVREYVKEGRFELVGGLYVEADANMVSGESYIRQFLYGMEVFREEFGVTPNIGWLPDTFGLSAILPQIYKKCGMEGFYSAKLRSNQHYKFPHTLYEWEGLDGSRVTATLDAHGTYNGEMTVRQIKEGLDTGAQPSAGNTQFYSVGHGDGGGGVTQEMLDRARVYDGLPSLPAIKWGTALEYFGGVMENKAELPVWRGEMYYDIHQGTLTSQAGLKRYNRRGEAALLAAEALGVMADARDEAKLRALWKPFLFNQFHDILPGSCQQSVVEAASAEYEKVLAGANGLIGKNIAAIASEKAEGMLTVFNTLSFARSGYVEAGGETLYAENVPAFGYKAFHMDDMIIPSEKLAREDAESITLENEFIKAVISKKSGELLSLYDKRAEREALRSAGNRILLYDEVYEFYEAWNIHPETLRHPRTPGGPVRVSLQKDADGVATVRVSRSLSEKSSLTQEINLTKNARRLTFHTEADWHETGVLMKVLFETDIRAEQAYYDLSYGNIARSTGENLPYDASQIEVCAHKWADLSDANFGLAILNDCKYGHRIKGGDMTLTLLKSPKYPDTEADMGHHEFTYALYPHTGGFREGETDREALDLNTPLLTSEPGRASANTEGSLLGVEGKGILIESIKRAHDGGGDIIVRAYENHGGSVKAAIRLNDTRFTASAECDMLENSLRELPIQGGEIPLSFTPYEIKTIRLK